MFERLFGKRRSGLRAIRILEDPGMTIRLETAMNVTRGVLRGFGEKYEVKHPYVETRAGPFRVLLRELEENNNEMFADELGRLPMPRSDIHGPVAPKKAFFEIHDDAKRVALVRVNSTGKPAIDVAHGYENVGKGISEAFKKHAGYLLSPKVRIRK